MKLKRFCLRYYPPGFIIEYEKEGQLRTKSIDLLELSTETDPDELVKEIVKSEPLITEHWTDEVKEIIVRLQQKKTQQTHHKFCFVKVLSSHLLPLTNVAFNKSGSKFITGSYDRTCRVWDTVSGTCLLTLESHQSVVYAIAFNNPFGDKIATSSFDKTCKLWCAETGKCFHTFRGHTAEIICLAFNPQSTLVATGSMDTTAKLWDVESGEEVATLSGHKNEVLCVCFNTVGNQLITGSFDHTMLWDTSSGNCVATLEGHKEELLDACFDLTGQLIATASADCESCNILCFNPQSTRLLTASSDRTARLWDIKTGECLQVLSGHTDEIFSCAFNYEGDTIITGSKDNTCRIWY
uniref:Uncharacterized protein n=1 Tax=Periophthalmus magnuspinnatus TaxID=409849 RepID=A0A3B4AGG0_9GOBI